MRALPLTPVLERVLHAVLKAAVQEVILAHNPVDASGEDEEPTKLWRVSDHQAKAAERARAYCVRTGAGGGS